MATAGWTPLTPSCCWKPRLSAAPVLSSRCSGPAVGSSTGFSLCGSCCLSRSFSWRTCAAPQGQHRVSRRMRHAPSSAHDLPSARADVAPVPLHSHQ